MVDNPRTQEAEAGDNEFDHTVTLSQREREGGVKTFLEMRLGFVAKVILEHTHLHVPPDFSQEEELASWRVLPQCSHTILSYRLSSCLYLTV